MNLSVEQNDMSVSDIVEEAKTIFKLIESRIKNEVKCEKIKEEVYRKYKDFCSVYIVPVDYMIIGLFHPVPFRKWIEYITRRQTEWKDDEKFFDCQADYVKILYRHFHPKMDTKQLSQIRNDVKKEYYGKHMEFKKNMKTSQKSIEERDERIQEEHKKALVDYFIKNNEELRSKFMK